MRKLGKNEEKKPGHKKIRKRWIVLGAAAVLAIVFFVYSRATAGSAVLPVSASTAYIGDVEESVSASGKVGSADSRTYFAPAASQVSQLNVKVGDSVKAGDMLLVFDTAELEQSKQKAELELSQASNSYQSAITESNEKQSEYADASLGLDELKQMEANQKQYVQGLKYELEDDKAARREDLYKWDKQLQEELNYQNRRLSEKQAAGADSDDIEKVQEVIDNISGQRTDVQNELSMIDDEEMLKQKQRLIDAEQKKLDEMSEEVQKRENKQDSSEAGILNNYSKQEKAVGVESARLSVQAAADDLAAAQAGIAADFDGIVTEVSVTQGATVAKGAQLFTVQSSQDVQVTVELSKYDLEKVKEGQKADLTIAGAAYQGTVERINRMAQNNAQNTPVVNADIAVTNPDENLYLGVEGKANIHTAKAEGAVLVPYEAVNTDKDGDFCYLVRDGLIVRQPVVTGISNDMDVEIKEGVSEGDIVVTDTGANLTEGMPVMPVVQ
ncbi:MAG: efflux RND transporter periplasmic adaptor subunit [Eubacteriales bacterium]|nr:efflux RND transporter periplasmic adaptor subunit [Eubacteriales bacterium]